MAVVERALALGALAVKYFEEDTPGAGDKTIPHGFPFTPRVYSVYAVDSAGTDVTAIVKSVDATNIVITGFGAGLDKVVVIAGP